MNQQCGNEVTFFLISNSFYEGWGDTKINEAQRGPQAKKFEEQIQKTM
jgi:hypothetical protein